MADSPAHSTAQLLIRLLFRSAIAKSHYSHFLTRCPSGDDHDFNGWGRHNYGGWLRLAKSGPLHAACTCGRAMYVRVRVLCACAAKLAEHASDASFSHAHAGSVQRPIRVGIILGLNIQISKCLKVCLIFAFHVASLYKIYWALRSAMTVVSTFSFFVYLFIIFRVYDPNFVLSIQILYYVGITIHIWLWILPWNIYEFLISFALCNFKRQLL